MFVRFREYKLARGGKSLRCEVVENYRDRCSGKVRQRSICYLASVREHWAKYARVRNEFWKRVDEKLSGLPLSESDAQKVRAVIEKRIPRAFRPAPRRSSTRKPANAGNAGSVQMQTLSSPAEAHEQTTEELLADLRRRLGVTI